MGLYSGFGMCFEFLLVCDRYLYDMFISNLPEFIGAICLILIILGFIGFSAVKLSDPKGKCSDRQKNSRKL